MRRASCQWEDGTTATALCRFQQSLIPNTLDREVLLRHLPDRDWTWMSARMIHVDSQSNNNGGWIVPRGCHQEPAADPA
ncbi:hypothetical protein [Allosphingosinicella deserti]|uniref:Uncharacterized protein n=1 Tax=Allosphingosinicella deserti TaxID=2116704 RepID=A0A2P7QRL1_9SPHN|nr:hypothetical protein [Sphingomonas deserti]PSJ40587.1 hypothetical protein C7I55_09680 [Sphingomonas deserti]